jgi:hypothetical protein
MDEIMSKNTHDDDSELVNGPVGLRDAVDRWGPDLGDWSDISMVRHAREALLSDRAFRGYRDGAQAMERQLATAAGALDERIAAAGSMDRITRKVMARAVSRPAHWGRRVAAVAAVMVVASLLGGASEWLRTDNGSGGRMVVVQLDPLVFGPAEVGF